MKKKSKEKILFFMHVGNKIGQKLFLKLCHSEYVIKWI
jgi:hypothetical protein